MNGITSIKLTEMNDCFKVQRQDKRGNESCFAKLNVYLFFDQVSDHSSRKEDDGLFCLERRCRLEFTIKTRSIGSIVNLPNFFLPFTSSLSVLI